MAYETLIEALASFAYYNGWNGILCNIRGYIESEIKKEHSLRYWNISFPKFLWGVDVDKYPCIIWFLLVEMFGDYGTSPRYGWIEGDKSNEALSWIETLCRLSSEECQNE